MKRSFRGWLSLRRKRRIVHKPFAPQASPRHTVHLSQLWKGKPQSSWDRRKCFPSQPVVATGEIPQTTRTPRLKVGSSQLSQMITIKLPVSPPRTPTPPQPSLLTQALALVWPPTLPCGFSGVTACLHTPELIEVDLEVPVGAMPIRLVATPGIPSVSSSCIVKDEITGITYMDTITTSIGRMTLSGPDPEACSTGPTIEDITDWV